MERQDILNTLGVLNNVERLLRAFALVGNEETKLQHANLAVERDRLKKLYEESEPGPMEKFRTEHPPLFDQLDSLYDCGNPNCPRSGFKNAEDKEHHYKMWGIEPRRFF